MLSHNTVKLNARAQNKSEAIRIAGQLLVDSGHAAPEYVESMLAREQLASTYMGGGLAIPHGTKDSEKLVHSTGLSIVQFPLGVDFGEGQTAYLLVGIAAAGEEHIELLTNVAVVCSDDCCMRDIVQASSVEQLMAVFEGRFDE